MPVVVLTAYIGAIFTVLAILAVEAATRNMTYPPTQIASIDDGLWALVTLTALNFYAMRSQ